MAIRPGARIPVHHETAFPHGCYATGDVSPVPLFDNGKNTGRQETDPQNGLLVWAVAVLDGDPELNAKAKSFQVKISAPHQPVLPDSPVPGLPVIPIAFDGLTVTPYVDNASKRLAYSYRAASIKAAALPAQATAKAAKEG
jgi:hypothetical protein